MFYAVQKRRAGSPAPRVARFSNHILLWRRLAFDASSRAGQESFHLLDLTFL